MGLKTLGITTNGLLLPRKLEELREAGVNRLNISLDSLQPKRFEAITRRKGFERVIEGIKMASELGYSPVKVNVVVMRGVNDDELADFVMFTKDHDVDVRFIEWMPFDSNQWNDSTFVSYAEMKEKIAAQLQLQAIDNSTGLPAKLLRTVDENRPHDTAKAYRVPGHVGRVGFITSMSEHFCGDCNRMVQQ